MACPPQSCCYCPGAPGHGGGPAAHGSPVRQGSPARYRTPRRAGSPVAASTPRRRPETPRYGGEQGGGRQPIADETVNEIEELESMGILQRSQIEVDIGHADDAGVDYDFSRSLILDAVPHGLDDSRWGDEPEGYVPGPMEGQMGGYMGGYEPEEEQDMGDQSMGLMDPGNMDQSMLGADYEFDHSGQEGMGAHPIQAMRDLSSGMEEESLGLLDPGFDREMMGANFHGGDEEVAQALEGADGNMTVYDPEDLNVTMAPRNNNIELRREVLYGTFNRELDDTEDDENEAVQELLLDFHQRRRDEAARYNEE